MSFVTVFTAVTMAFVLLVPVLMVLAMAPGSPLRRPTLVETRRDAERQPAGPVSRAA